MLTTPLMAERNKLYLEATTSAATMGGGTSANRQKAPFSYYRQLEASYVQRGHLRSEHAPQDVPWDRATLAENFIQIALYNEYNNRNGGFSSSKTESVLRRWEKPVRISTVYGKGVSPERRQAFSREISRTVQTLRSATGHSISRSNDKPNLLVLVVGEKERQNLKPFLTQKLPDISPQGLRAIINMPKNVMCMVLARPYSDLRHGYKGAVVVVRAEHSQRMRKSCIQEELAQSMGLPNDSPMARPSIFNDNEEFGVLTNHDLALLRMLYDDRLRPGMTIEQVKPLLPALTKAALH
ncbi:DUF2927 domain-containing protein [Pseudaestuariivita rosea]|uniref:DUF2927 domain-containing protein n=1 Tax=Pseudaestuariivita rosea TaxID=2763263 RepID=UPI001ABAD12E|nr:DUF2927 domain-containing protein [Pseudaestuariivita rosea]